MQINTNRSRWLEVLGEQCTASSQAKVASRLCVSTAMISQALKGIYPGNLERLEKAVRGEYMGETVFCPVLGEIDTNRCQQNQRRKLSAVNPLRVQLYRACNGKCENAEKNKGAEI